MLAFHKAVPLSLSVARIINWMHTILRPLIWVMNQSSTGLLWLFGQRDLTAHTDGHFSMTGEEIRTILNASEQEGVLDAQLTKMLRGVFDLDEHTARDAMVPRTEVDAVEHTATVADILEEIVGDYEDEFTPRHRHIKKVDDHHYTINGGVRVTELEPKLNFPFPTGDYVTLGGLIHHRLGRIAAVGDVVQLEGARLTVVEMDNHRITSVLFEDAAILEEAEETEGHSTEDTQNAFVHLASEQSPQEHPVLQLAYQASGRKEDSGPEKKVLNLDRDTGS